MLVNKLNGLGLDNVLHRQMKIAHGSELVKTFFHIWNPEMGHHNDYGFLTSTVEAKVSVGEPVTWLAHSDHIPMILEVA